MCTGGGSKVQKWLWIEWYGWKGGGSEVPCHARVFCGLEEGCEVLMEHGAGVFVLRSIPFIFLFFFGFWIHTASAWSTAGTHTDGGAVIRKRVAQRHSRNGPWNEWQTHAHVAKLKRNRTKYGVISFDHQLQSHQSSLACGVPQKLPSWRGVGYLSNERAFLVESSLQRISSKKLS